MKVPVVLLGCVLAIVAGFFVAMLARGSAPARSATTLPSTTVTVPSAEPVGTPPLRSRSGAVAKNRAFVAIMFSGRPAWWVGYKMSYSPVLSRFDDLVVSTEGGYQYWQVVHLVFRWEGTKWKEIANTPNTALGEAVSNDELAGFQPFAP